MKNPIRTLAFTAACILTAGSPALAQAEQPVNQTEFLHKAEDIIDAYAMDGWFSGSVSIYKDTGVLYEKSYGFADIHRGIKNASSTKIRIGSITKHLTAALVLRHVQKGDLSLDDSLAKFALGFPDDIAGAITVRHLLAHRSGFQDIFNDDYFQNYRSMKTIRDKLPLLINAPLMFEPGSDQSYSNYGYIVLGAILEKITGQDFGTLLDQEILTPIGAEDTVYDLTENVSDKALSYHFSPSGQKEDKTGMLENVTPDGGMYSTPTDMALFYSKLFYSDAILGDPMKAIMARGYSSEGKAWSEIAANPQAVWNSYGGGPGVSAAVEVLIKDRLFIVVLANTDGLVAEEISQRLADLYRGAEPKAVTLPLAFFVGTYIKQNGIEAFARDIENALQMAGYADFGDRPLNKLGFDLLKHGQTAEAFAVFEKNTELFPNRANTFDSLAYAYEQVGDTHAAAINYEKALAVDPGFQSALDGLQRLKAVRQP